jgi:TPR repeat protein
MMVLAHIYQSGTYGLKVNGKKSGGLIEKAAKLGCPMALYNLGENHVRRHERMMSSPFGMLGVDLGTPYNDSLKKGKDYLERAAIKGSLEARFRLGKLEMELPNASDRSIKHFVIGAKAGHEPSLKYVEKAHTEGGISKDDYCEVLREYLTNSDALKSQQREKSEAYCGMMPDGELFNEDFPPGRKCPSCTVPLPYTNRDLVYMPCCGGMLCQGCSLKLCAKCPFCETTAKDDNEVLVNQLKKRMEMNDAEAYNEMGMCHKNGLYGVRQDYEKAIKMFEKAGKVSHCQLRLFRTNVYRHWINMIFIIFSLAVQKLTAILVSCIALEMELISLT